MGMCTHENPNKGFTDDWWTPLDYISPLGPFDLDPCGNATHPTAMRIFQSEGLEQEWFGMVWLNPPYSEVGKWLDKLHLHGKGIALVFARTDTKWAQKHMPLASSVFFLANRIKFLKSGVSPKWTSGAPSMFLAYGEKPKWPFRGWCAK